MRMKISAENRKIVFSRFFCCIYITLQSHEYGHTIQSLLLGPLYLIVIGLPSLVWSRWKRFIRLRREKGIPYFWFYTERWADWLGERITKEKSGGE